MSAVRCGASGGAAARDAGGWGRRQLLGLGFGIAGAVRLGGEPGRAAAEAAAPGLRQFRRGSWAALRAGDAGRRTLGHFWGRSCGPCLLELPGWGGLAGAAAGRVVTVAADPFPSPPAALRSALAEAGLAEAGLAEAGPAESAPGGAEAWYFAERFPGRLYAEVDPDWQGELPYTVRLDRDGSASGRIGVADLAALGAWLRG